MPQKPHIELVEEHDEDLAGEESDSTISEKSSS
jgi:hypothetical protein